MVIFLYKNCIYNYLIKSLWKWYLYCSWDNNFGSMKFTEYISWISRKLNSDIYEITKKKNQLEIKAAVPNLSISINCKFNCSYFSLFFFSRVVLWSVTLHGQIYDHYSRADLFYIHIRTIRHISSKCHLNKYHICCFCSDQVKV